MRTPLDRKPDISALAGWTWPLLLAAACFAIILPNGGRVLGDPDSYWHVRSGNWILQHHHVPLTDPFSFTAAGAQWVPHEWLADVVMALTYNLTGWFGLVVLTLLAFTVSLALLWHYCARFLRLPHVAIMVLLSYLLLTGHLLARPHVLVMPVQILWFIGLVNARDAGRAPTLWLLPLIAIWGNMHGSYVLGLGFAAMLAAEALISAKTGAERLAVVRSWGLFGLLGVAAVLVNPLGLEVLLLPFKMTGISDIRLIAEWKSPDFGGWEPFGLWLILVMFGAVTLGVRVPVSRAAMLVLLLYMALSHRRHIDLIALISPVLLARPLGEELRARLGEVAAPFGPAVTARIRVGALAGAGAAMVAAFLMVPAGGLRPQDDITPSKAVAAVAQAGITGPVLNDWNFGGYLIFKGIPTFIDGRADPFPDALISDQGAAVKGDAVKLQQLLAQHKIEWTLLLPDRPANSLLDHLPGWRRFYADKYAIVHVRADRPAPKTVSQNTP